MKKLKILVFEYITGGGLNKSNLSASLAREGLLMLQALVDDLSGITTVEPLIMLDLRMMGKLSAKSIGLHFISQEHECHQEFIRLMPLCDAVWPIAPESDSNLKNLCKAAERSGKILLTSPASAVAIAGNKWLTYLHLWRHFIATVPTQRLTDFCFSPGEWIIKPVDGVGCADSYLIADQQVFDTITTSLDRVKYIVQPHIQGEKTSLSCMFKQGHGWLLCANRQHFDLINNQYNLSRITVNFTFDTAKYQVLLNKVGRAMPDLWGYVGIDLIETADEIFILEINPRLTTSYAGIHEALGINCAQVALDLIAGEPLIKPNHNQAVNIIVNEQKSYAS